MESTSHKPQNTNADGEEDIVDLCRRLDTKLEEKARMHNLNALNVKSILNRLIKNPNVLTTLMGIEGDTDDIPSIKVTRSKVKHSAAEAAKVELKPIRPPRTFLDVQFDDEDDNDEDYRPEEVHNGGGDEEEENETSTAADPNQIRRLRAMSVSSADHPSDALGDHETEHCGTEVSAYQLRSRVPHIDDNCPLESLNTSFTEESFETFAGYRGQEMLTFVENPDYLDFLQGIHASTPVNENGNTAVDDDDPDDEEYNVLTELEGLKSIEKDADELRMDRFTEIPSAIVLNFSQVFMQMLPVFLEREVEGLFLDLIGSDMETIGPELMLQKIPSPKKKRSKRRSGEKGRNKQSNSDRKNELDSWYYACGESSFFNISNLGAAIESCHDIMGISPVAQEHVKWEPTPFGWSPRPEAALVLGRSRAVIYPDLLPGVQPDLFAFPHQFFTAGEDLLLAHALIQFRHISHSNSQDPFGRLYWVQRMLLPCKTVDVCFHRNDVHLKTGVDARPVLLCYESVTGSFPSSCAIRATQHQQNASQLIIICFPNAPSSERANAKDDSDVHQQPTMLSQQSRLGEPHQKSLDFSLTDLKNPTIVVNGAEPDASASSLGVQVHSTSSNLAEPQFSIFESGKEFSIQPGVKYEELHLPKSEFSLETELEEGEIVSDENSQDTPTATDRRYSSKNYSPKRTRTECQRGHTRRERTVHVAKFVYTPLKRKRDSNKSTRKSWHAPTIRDRRYSSRDYSPNRTRIERERVDARRKQAANVSKFVYTPLKRKTDCNKKCIERNNNRPTRNNENLPRQTFRHLEAHQVRNEVQGAARKVRSKRRLSSPEWGSIGCLNKKRRDMENTLVKKGIGTSSEDQRIMLEGHKRDNNYGYVGGRFENYRHEGINDRTRIRRSASGRKLSTNSNSEVQRNFSQSGGEVHEISCDTVCALRASDRAASVNRVNVKNDLLTLEKDIAAERRVETLNNLEYGEIEDDLTQSNCSTHSADTEDHAKSPLKTWKDSDYTNDEYDNDPLTSDMETDSPVREFESPYILRTPTFNTPSDYSPVESISHLRTPSSEYDVGIPVTPRDDVLTRSPTLLRAPSAVSRALFSKIQIKHLPTDNTDLNNCDTSSNCLRDTWDFVEGYSLEYVNILNVRLSTKLDAGEQINDDSEDAPGSEMYSERMGLERMQSPHHRALQMINLARKIADDIKQRTFMHQDVWHTVERIVLGEESMEAQFDRLKAALLPKHADVLALLSLLADDSVLPPELLTSPLRRAYHGAVQMLLAIELNCNGLGKTLSEVEFCDRLADLLGNERPLWNYIRHWLPLAYDEKVTAADFEFIDLCRRTDSELIEDGGAECIDDLNAVLGPQPPRKGGSLQVFFGAVVYVPYSESTQSDSELFHYFESQIDM
ncbi:unnamed protein product [Angiostrongylus costaricensis]|uniref:MKLP1_Arf_bdg domain-containing protein n=1 Tax=Angiostrongylus costaricensis TaxID=334426 RepID=A0A158PKC3_ANGCS|nr:unnamed protein product [Angiostrongylus costaricensis]